MYEHMRSRALPALGAAILFLLATAPLTAQSHRVALGVTGGWSTASDLTPGMGYATEFEPGWTAGIQLERWFGRGRVALRLDGSYAERPMADQPTSDYNIYSADVALLVRLLSARESRLIAPYIALGGGGIHYNPADPSVNFAGGAFGEEPVIRAMAVGAVGLDLASSSPFGLRLEFADKVVLPGFGIGESPEMDGVPMSHNLQFQGAVQLRMGRINTPVVLAAARPERAEPAPAAVRAEPAAERPVEQPVRPAVEPAASAEVAQLRSEVGQWQGRVTALAYRVDSLETAVERTRATVMASSTAASAAPAAAAAPAPAPSRPARVDGPPRYTVQVGAFVEESTAKLWAERLRARDLPVWVAEVTIRGQQFSRVRVGAVPSHADALALAEALKSAYGWPVWVDRVATADRVPQGAVAATMAFLR